MISSKKTRYKNIIKEIMAVLDGESNMIARYSTVACMLNGAFDYFYWTGFYLVDLKKHNELVIGPYQGTLGCLRIPFGKGVCGLSAKTKKTFIVSDVHNFENHIVCDINSQSEIVVPVLDKNSKLMAILDVDSTELDAFDEVDKSGLENICSLLII
tara:strand:- start:43 stop:510 length:468 start_codon:yes stop_codon:yes gene_type:complete